MPTWLVVVLVLASVGSIALAGFVVYRLRLRNAMHQEIRDIMRQYMPLDSAEGANGEAAQPLRAASNGGVGSV